MKNLLKAALFALALTSASGAQSQPNASDYIFKVRTENEIATLDVLFQGRINFLYLNTKKEDAVDFATYVTEQSGPSAESVCMESLKLKNNRLIPASEENTFFHGEVYSSSGHIKYEMPLTVCMFKLNQQSKPVFVGSVSSYYLYLED